LEKWLVGLVCIVLEWFWLNPIPKKVFRMSGPAVVIGFILLVPSILGIVASGLLLLGVVTTTGIFMHAIDKASPEGFDNAFRRACINAPNSRLPMSEKEQYCECALTEYKESNSLKYTSDICTRKLQYNTLTEIDEETQRVYDGLIDASGPQKNNTVKKVAVLVAGIAGSGYAIGLGIACFVGGLLGWLLVMKKRVLQCSACGATVNAS
jgi:hypothetical protein